MIQSIFPDCMTRHIGYLDENKICTVHEDNLYKQNKMYST